MLNYCFVLPFMARGTPVPVKVFDSASQEAGMESEGCGYKTVTIVLPSGEWRDLILLIMITN